MPSMSRPGINLHDLAAILWVPIGMGSIMSVGVLILGEAGFVLSFALMTAVAGGLRWLLRRAGRATVRQYTAAETMATVALAWVLVALLAAIPFWLAPLTTGPVRDVTTFDSMLNGLFESVSGITSTGLSMVATPSELPASLQFWRSFTEWVGGVGIALLMITLMNPKDDAAALFDTELNKNFADDAQQTARWIWKIYAGLSVFAVGLFLLLGMPPWQALNHGLTGIATGGFSVTDDSFSAYPLAIQIAASVVMIAGAISFAAYRLAVQRRNPLQLLRQGPTLALLIGIALATGILWVARLGLEADGGFYAACFQAVSAFATAGFSTTDLSEWNSATLAILVTCMFIGGATGATTGGVKIDRILLLARGIGWRLLRQFGSRPAEDVRIGDESFPPEVARLQVESAATLVALWMLTVLIGCLSLSVVVGDEWTFTQVGFEVMSAISSVGLSTGITSAELPDAGKWILMLLMWAGRLELFALLALLWLPVARSPRTMK